MTDDTRHPRSAETSRLSESEAESLIGSARDGSTQAIGLLLQTTREQLLRVAHCELPLSLRAKEGLSDVVQETFLVAHRRFGQFDGRTIGELLLWLKAILRHTTAHRKRSFRAGRREQSREVRLDADAAWAAGLCNWDASPSSVAQRNEMTTNLVAAVERLSARDRQILWLKHRDQLTFEEVGRRLAISTVGARNAWVRALRRLREELERSGGLTRVDLR